MMKTSLDQIEFMSRMLDMNAFKDRLTQMLASEAMKEATKSLKIEAAVPLAYLATVQTMDRTPFKE